MTDLDDGPSSLVTTAYPLQPLVRIFSASFLPPRSFTHPCPVMPASAPPRNRLLPNGRSKPALVAKKKTTAVATKPETRPKKARARREGDEDIVREGRSDDDLQSDADDDDDDDDDSSFTSSIASVPERLLTRKASNGKGKGQPTASAAGSSTLPVMQFPDEDVNGRALLSSLHNAHHAWSDMVAHADGDDLPVLDFADMRAPSPAGEDEPDLAAHVKGARSEAKPSAGSVSHRPIGISARKAYLQRLEADPSYTPRVGEFWSHDERLLDKDLRSLSGWWRGRWRGRGRGGFGTGWTGRRPGGRFPGREQWGIASESNDPTDQDWRHDGYEEFEQAKEAQAPRQPAEQSPGRGGFWSTRGRGRSGTVRSGFQHSDPVKSSNETPSSHERTPHVPTRPSPTPRLWYRPEYAWTRHAATYLFSDGSPKPRFGGGGRLRVKLPGQTRYTFVRLSPVGTNSEPAASTPSQPTRQVVVRLPKVKGSKEEGGGEEAPLSPPALLALQPEDAHTVAPLLDELNVTGPVPASAPDPAPKSALVAHEPAVQVAPSDIDPPASTPLVQRSPLLLSEPAPAQQGPEVAPLAMLPPPLPMNQPMVQIAPTPTVPSPSYPSPSYPPAPFPYSLHHPVATYPAPMQEQMWYDPRMPYGYPTPPPPPQNMYTPPPPSAMHHHHHSHSHSISLPPMIHPPHGPSFFGMPPPPVPRPTPIEQLGPSISYGPNGAMVDTATGTPIFSWAKPRVRVNIRKPGESPSPSNAPNDSISSEGSSRALTNESAQSLAPTEEQERPKSLERRATEPAQTFSANNPYAPQAQQQQPWDPYSNPMGGYYYPPPPPMHPQQYPSPAEFGYPSGVPQAASGYPPYPDSVSQGPPADFQHPPQNPPVFY